MRKYGVAFIDTVALSYNIKSWKIPLPDPDLCQKLIMA